MDEKQRDTSDKGADGEPTQAFPEPPADPEAIEMPIEPGDANAQPI